MDIEDTQPLALPFQPVDPDGDGPEDALVARAGTEVAPAEVHEGEVLTAEESAALDRRRQGATRLLPPPQTRQRMGAAGRTGMRHGRYLRLGTRVAVCRWRDAHGSARFERQMRAAEAAGDHDRLGDWQTRARTAAAERYERRQAWAEAPIRLIKALGGGVAAGLLVLILVGLLLAAAYGDIALFTGPFEVTATVVRVLVTVVAWAWLPGLVLAGVAGVGWLWRTGRDADPGGGTAPAAALGQGAARDVVPDETAILSALRNLGISKLEQQLKAGWVPRWIQPPARDAGNRGWVAHLELPQGATVGMITDRKEVLAHNLVRLPVEVWPTEPKNAPGTLHLWVGDQGSLTGKVPDWPLLHTGSTDYFGRGIPVGINLQGNTITGGLCGKNWGVAGTMGSGKSTLIITALLGAMLDPLVEIDVYCMAYNADYDPLKPRLRTLAKGDEQENIHATLDGLREVFSDLSVRGQILSEYGEPKLTRDIAARDHRMRPRVIVIDECQELFMHGDYGDEAAQLVEKMVSKARKYGVTMIFATPVPSADSLPRAVTKVLSNKAMFAIGDHQGNDALLDTGSHKAGISAVSLRPMTDDDPGDVGNCMQRGFTASPGLMRCYRVARGQGVDQVSPVVQRAVQLREDAGIAPATQHSAPAGDQRDLLDHLHEVLGHDTVTAAEAGQALVGKFGRTYYRTGPHEKPRAITGRELAHELAAYGIKVPSTGNKYPLDPAVIRQTRAERGPTKTDTDSNNDGGDHELADPSPS